MMSIMNPRAALALFGIGAASCASQSVRPNEPATPPAAGTESTAVAPANSAATAAARAPKAEISPEAAEVLEKHIAAIGGRAAHEAIKTVESEREIEIFGSTQKRYEIRESGTRRFYAKVEGSNGLVESGFDGKRGWERSPFFRGYFSDSDPRAKGLRRKRHELYQYRESERPFARLPNETVNGKELIVVGSRSTDFDPNGREAPIKYYFDPQTFYLVQIIAGEEVTQTQSFADFRQVDATWVPFTTTIKSPQAMLTSRLKSIRYNPLVDPSRFEFPDGSGKEATASDRPAAAPSSAEPQGTSPKDALRESDRLDAFELVWSTVNDTYWDPTFGGVDWKAVHDKYLPRAKATTHSEDFHALLNEMVAELDRSHFRVRPPEETAGLHSQASDLRNGSIGVELRWIDRQLIVFDTKKGFPADQAGIGKGWRILTINGKDPDQLLADFKKKKGFLLRDESERVRAAINELTGKAGTTVELVVERAASAGPKRSSGTKKMELTRKARPPEQVAEVESRKLEGNIGYVRLSIFFGDALPRVKEAIEGMRDTEGLIFDLRGNPGGAGDLPEAIAGLLCAEPGSLGISKSRYGERQHSYQGSGKNAYAAPVVLLVDELTGSAAEVFAGGLQENGRATVVGTTTAGAVLPSTIKLLPTGGALQHVISDFRTPKGTVLERRGVIPDVVAKPSRAAMLKGRDLAAERAVRVLRSKVARSG